jgi:RNA polymerase sigma-70 factor (ECF subfamily)
MEVVDGHFERWYEAEHPKLITALTVIAGDASLAAEAVDEAFARAYERWGRISRMESPEGWTYRTAMNALRRRQRRRHLEHQLHLRRAASSSATAAVADWSPEVWDAVRRLPPRERTTVALRYVADLSTDDIAVAMGVAPGTVGAALHSARRRLAAALSDSMQEVTDA